MAKITKPKDYDTTEAYTERRQLPKGGYVLKVLGADLKENSNGQYVQLGCDIVEGDFKDFFAQDWKAQTNEDKKWHCNYLLNLPKDDGSETDGWTKKKLKTVMLAFEASNEGYHWDWDTDSLKGKLIGGLFNTREYVGRDNAIHQGTNLAQLTNVDAVRKGTYKLPKDKLIERGIHDDPVDEFMSIPDADADALPFA